MNILLDTNVLLRFADDTHPSYPTVVSAVDKLRDAGHTPLLVPQNYYEFWVVATRPTSGGGFGLTVPACVKLLQTVDATFPVLADAPSLLATWRVLVARHDCKGKIAHDVRLVAAMQTHGMTRLLTFNGKDFARFPGITVLDPARVAATGFAP